METDGVIRGNAENTVRNEQQEFLRKHQERAFNTLQEMKLIERDDEGNIVIDIGIIRGKREKVHVEIKGQQVDRTLSEALTMASNRIVNGSEFGNGNLDRALFYFFDGVPVIDKTEYDNARKNGYKAQPRQLFYIPENRQRAFTVEDPDADPQRYYLNFAEVGKNKGIYPTKEDRFESGLTTLDVGLFDLVYRKLDGHRDDAGRLFVTQNGDPNERLTVDAIYTNLALRKEPATAFLQRLSQRAPYLYEERLFREEDIDRVNYPSKETIGNIVGSGGHVTVDGLRIFLGKEKAVTGSRFEQLSPGKYVVYKEDQTEGIRPVMEFRSQIIPTRDAFASIDLGKDGKARLRASEGAVYKRRYDNQNTIAYVQYSENGRTIKNINEKQLIQALLEQRAEMAMNGINSTMMASYNVETQAIIEQEIQRIKTVEKKDPYEFIRQHQEVALQVLEKESISGGIDHEVLEWAKNEPEKAKEVMNMFLKMHKTIDKFESALMRRFEVLRETNEEKDEIMIAKYFMAKTANALRYKAGMFLHAAATGETQIAQEQLELLSSCMEGFSGIINGNGRLRQNKFTEDKARDGSKAFVVWEFASDAGEQMAITVRPEEKYSAATNRQGQIDQARIAIRFKNKDKKEVNIRIDRDPQYGVSLDIGRKGDELSQMAERYGQTHHTQVTYDKAFNDPKVFTETAKTFCLALNYDFDAA